MTRNKYIHIGTSDSTTVDGARVQVHAWHRAEDGGLTLTLTLDPSPSSGARVRHIGVDVTPEMAEKLIPELQALVHRAEAKAAREDARVASAMVPGTLVRIAEVPMYSRTLTLDNVIGDGRAVAGELGVVVYQVFNNYPEDDPIGVAAGRVVVSTDLDAQPGSIIGKDIHVSSLSVVTDEDVDGFHDPKPVYTPHSEYQVGDIVIVGDQAGTGPRPYQGYVNPQYLGKAGQVTRVEGGEGVVVIVNPATDPNDWEWPGQYIHPAHLRNISAEFRAADKAAGGVL